MEIEDNVITALRTNRKSCVLLSLNCFKALVILPLILWPFLKQIFNVRQKAASIRLIRHKILLLHKKSFENNVIQFFFSQTLQYRDSYIIQILQNRVRAIIKTNLILKLFLINFDSAKTNLDILQTNKPHKVRFYLKILN